jgi:AbrB family looped-hinge helix DNA binding protein
MRYETSMTVKGQITVPKDVRDMLGLKPGQKVRIETDPDGTVRIMKAEPPTRDEWLTRLREAQQKFGGKDRFMGMDGLEYQRWIRPDRIDI